MKRISVDNGQTYVTPAEAVQGMDWDTIVDLMDDDAREAAHAEGIDNETDFLARYLEIAPEDLIIG